MCYSDGTTGTEGANEVNVGTHFRQGFDDTWIMNVMVKFCQVSFVDQ